MPALRSRRRRSSPHPGLSRTRRVRCVFMLRNVTGRSYGPFSSFATLSGDLLPIFTTFGVGTNNNAVFQTITFPLSHLFGAATNYNAVSRLYEAVKLRKVKCVFTPCVEPARAIYQTQVGFGNWDFSNIPKQLTAVSFIDRLAPQVAVVRVGASGASRIPSNGDWTQYCLGKLGAREHRMWKPIRRTFIPHYIQQVAGAGAKPTVVTGIFAEGKRPGYQTQPDSPMYQGTLCIAFPYCGATNTLQQQPLAYYSIETQWFLEFLSPLFG